MTKHSYSGSSKKSLAVPYQLNCHLTNFPFKQNCNSHNNKQLYPFALSNKIKVE